jgi:hypothetical protein
MELTLKKWRRELGLTQPQAGAALDLGLRTIAYYEAGDIGHPVPRVVRLAMAYLLEHPEQLKNGEEK